jgi:hypothetical protein
MQYECTVCEPTPLEEKNTFRRSGTNRDMNEIMNYSYSAAVILKQYFSFTQLLRAFRQWSVDIVRFHR